MVDDGIRLLLKEDGVWRLTGGAGAWDVQPFDPTNTGRAGGSIRPWSKR